MINLSKKLVPALILLAANCQIHASNSSEIDTFKHSWVAHVLKLQRDIDLNAPLKEATFIGTHNSYNSKAYQIPIMRYIDPNQKISIYDQLETGARSIELDAHWTYDNYFSKDILLCHAKNTHLGCGIFDRKITEGLLEIRKWLKENPNEVVLLYIERHLDKHEPRLAAMLDLNLGEFIYKPSAIRTGDDEKACVSLPTDISKADILRAGKQLLIVTKGCDGSDAHYQETDKYKQNWNDFVFSGIGNVPGVKFTFLDMKPNDFIGMPDCGKSDDFSIDVNHDSMWRIFEDRTIYSNIPVPTKKVDEYEMMEMVQCGINWQTMDMLKVGDERLKAAIWTWMEDYPKFGAGDCAIYKNNIGFMNVSCETVSPAMACRNDSTKEIAAVPTSGKFKDGDAACTVKGEGWHFYVPVNGAQLNALSESMDNIGVSEVLLNYHRNKDDTWLANN